MSTGLARVAVVGGRVNGWGSFPTGSAPVSGVDGADPSHQGVPMSRKEEERRELELWFWETAARLCICGGESAQLLARKCWCGVRALENGGECSDQDSVVEEIRAFFDEDEAAS